MLVVPSVLAMLGDNPMQSKIACHIGLAGKLFCRVCRVSKGSLKDESEAATGNNDPSEVPTFVDDTASSVKFSIQL